MSLKLRKECTLCVSKDSLARDAPAVVGSFFNLEDVRKYNRYTPSTRVKDWPNVQREWEQTLAIEFAKSSPHIEHLNVCVYHLFKDRCTHCGDEQTLRCFDVYPFERLQSAEEESPFTMTLWESTGIEVRLSTVRKERRSSTSGSRNQVVARNLLVSYRDFEAAHIFYSRENLFKSSATDKDNQITLNAESVPVQLCKYIFFFLVLLCTNLSKIFFYLNFCLVIYLSTNFK